MLHSGSTPRISGSQVWTFWTVQAVISWAEHRVRHRDVSFPVGKTRLEAIGVIGCAVIMSISTLEVIRTASETLYDGVVM